MKKALTVAAELAFKPFKLYPTLHKTSVVLLGLILGLIGWEVKAHWSSSIPGVGEIVTIFILVVLVLIGTKEFFLERVLKYHNSYLQIVVAFFMCFAGWIIFYPYLSLIDSLYVKWGSGYRHKS